MVSEDLSLIVSFFPLRQMLFPKMNSVAQPSFGIGACAEPEAVTCSSVSTIVDFYSGVSQLLDALVNDRSIRNTVICAYRNKGRGEILGITRLTGVRNDNYCWLRQITAPIICNAA